MREPAELEKRPQYVQLASEHMISCTVSCAAPLPLEELEDETSDVVDETVIVRPSCVLWTVFIFFEPLPLPLLPLPLPLFLPFLSPLPPLF